MLRRLPAALPEANKTLVLQMILKVADLGHLSHPMPLHKVCARTHHPTPVMQVGPASSCTWLALLCETEMVMLPDICMLFRIPLLYMQKWLQGLEEEFFAQGDFEAELGLPITPFMDRAMPGISSKQVRCLRNSSQESQSNVCNGVTSSELDWCSATCV